MDGKEPQAPPPGILFVLKSHPFLASLLIFVPFGIASFWLDWPMWAIFTCNFFSILPMAWLLGKATEDLSASTGEIVGGLMNATFGNIVEVLLCFAGIRQDQIEVVQCTLVGSVISNLLLVMGSSFIWGGMHYKIQRFSKAGAGAQSSLMLLSSLGLTLPTMYSALISNAEDAVVDISRTCSILMLLVYVQYLIFQLKTHEFLFRDEGDEGEDEEAPDLSMWCAGITLAVCTVLTACCTEYLIHSIEGTVKSAKISKSFIGIIILPIIGNAAEHYTAIIVAGRNKMDLSLGVAIGSSCQIALLVTPLTVICGWIMDKPMSLDFQPFQACVLFMSVVIVSNVLQDGESNWLEGSMLCTAYGAIAVIYFFEARMSSSVLDHFAH